MRRTFQEKKEVQKSLWLLRHGSHGPVSEDDPDPALSEEGKQEMQHVGEFLIRQGQIVPPVVSLSGNYRRNLESQGHLSETLRASGVNEIYNLNLPNTDDPFEFISSLFRLIITLDEPGILDLNFKKCPNTLIIIGNRRNLLETLRVFMDPQAEIARFRREHPGWEGNLRLEDIIAARDETFEVSGQDTGIVEGFQKAELAGYRINSNRWRDCRNIGFGTLVAEKKFSCEDGAPEISQGIPTWTPPVI